MADDRVNACRERHVLMKFLMNEGVKPADISTEEIKDSTLWKCSAAVSLISTDDGVSLATLGWFEDIDTSLPGTSYTLGQVFMSTCSGGVYRTINAVSIPSNFVLLFYEPKGLS
ncbi:hypothetical protein BsWGS_13202 [Bradybaena similaris]